MTVTSGIVLFVLIWWCVFFMVLPWGIRRAGGEDRGHDAGAPANPRLLMRVSVTTGLSLVLFGAAFWLIETQGLSFR